MVVSDGVRNWLPCLYLKDVRCAAATNQDECQQRHQLAHD